MTGRDTSRSPFALFADREFAALALMNFATWMTFATIVIALALYADLFEASGFVAGLFGTAYGLVRLGLVVPIGRYFDVRDAKRLLLVGMALNVAVLVGFVFVDAVEHVILLRAFQGAGSITVYIGGIAVVGDIAPGEERGKWIGTYSQLSSLAGLAGDLVGGGLLYLYGFRTTYAVMIVVTVVATLALFRYLRSDPGGSADPDERSGVQTLALLVRRRAIVALSVSRFVFSFGWLAVSLFLPIYARAEFGLSALLIGAVLAGGRITKGVTQGYVGDVADRVGRMEWFVAVGAVLYAAGTLLIPFTPLAAGVFNPVTVAAFDRELTLAPGFFALFVLYALMGLVDCLRLPTGMALFVEEGKHYDAVAGSLSIRSFAWQLGSVLGPLAFGVVLDLVSYTAAFWLAGGCMIASAVVLLALYETEAAPADATNAT